VLLGLSYGRPAVAQACFKGSLGGLFRRALPLPRLSRRALPVLLGLSYGTCSMAAMAVSSKSSGCVSLWPRKPSGYS
jgi:hypothetical protein